MRDVLSLITIHGITFDLFIIPIILLTSAIPLPESHSNCLFEYCIKSSWYSSSLGYEPYGDSVHLQDILYTVIYYHLK